MSERLQFFAQRGQTVALALEHSLAEIVAEWDGLRSAMIRQMPTAFDRQEWAYLISFLDASRLDGFVRSTFGEALPTLAPPVRLLYRTRGPISVWLPGNVSLLGPLSLVIMSLSGSPLRLKGSSRAEDLAGAFVGFAREHAQGALRRYLDAKVTHELFAAEDPRSIEMAGSAKVRVVFGSDETAAEIDSLAHPLDSVGIHFTDRRSEVWLDPEAANDDTLTELIKVFAIYGQAGCTSPHLVVLLDSDESTANAVAESIERLWPSTIRGEVPPHIASQSILAQQLAAAGGWSARTVKDNAAVIATGSSQLPIPAANNLLPLTWSTLDARLKRLPSNVQTVGYAVKHDDPAPWLDLLGSTAIKRFVPLNRMHDFGPVWDGIAFFEELFEKVEVDLWTS